MKTKLMSVEQYRLHLLEEGKDMSRQGIVKQIKANIRSLPNIRTAKQIGKAWVLIVEFE